ncbi:MAG: hypothetical protein DRJ46_01505 [Thermoprotei archaeon]|nr:MAG: hypothetical protein DRJ46_01505 [Thermoprotei archaeon]
MEEKATKLAMDELPLDIRRQILLRREQGWSLEDLQDWIFKVTGKKYSLPSISLWIKRRKDTICRMVYGSEEFKERVAQEFARILINARKITDGLVERFETINKCDGPTKELCLVAETFLKYFESIKQLVKDVHGVEELEPDLPRAIAQMKAQGLIRVRKVSPED